MRVEGSVFRVQDSGLRAQGSGFRVQGSGTESAGELVVRARGEVRGSLLGDDPLSLVFDRFVV